ncbi:MAG: hypothetical protein LIP01_08400 [Tannerellaceae bacterium]|nr:hypothetical protein [Tannerellaceae bacterium]
MIGGYYKKEEKSKMVYYPLDFVDQTDNDKLVQILRNHKYEFTVTSISGEGYEDEEEAAKAPPVNMEYGIYEWIHHEDEDIGIDGPYYLSINSKKVQLDPPAGSSISLSLTTNVPDEMISCSLEGVKSTVIDQDNVFQKVESNLYRVELIKENGEIATLVFTALADWVNSNEQTLILTAGRIRFEIVITRLEPNDTSWIDGGDTNMDEDDYE